MSIEIHDQITLIVAAQEHPDWWLLSFYFSDDAATLSEKWREIPYGATHYIDTLTKKNFYQWALCSKHLVYTTINSNRRYRLVTPVGRMKMKCGVCEREAEHQQQIDAVAKAMALKVDNMVFDELTKAHKK